MRSDLGLALNPFGLGLVVQFNHIYLYYVIVVIIKIETIYNSTIYIKKLELYYLLKLKYLKSWKKYLKKKNIK